jgi:aspartate kinase
MALIVQKYGGTSVGDPERIQNVARRCLAAQAAGHDVVVVVSAMSGETNRLLQLVSRIAERPNEREQDLVVATGEQVSVGLVALAIQAQGGRATGFLGHQVAIVTDSTFSKARIKHIDTGRIRQALKEKQIAVVAGFQGQDEQGHTTTLGRGGSDTTAVALAAALQADACEIYTDVEGVYTADPRLCPSARKLERIAYEEMLELASLGAKVLQIRSVEFAMKYKVPLWVKSSFTDDPGTLVCKEDKSMEELAVSGIAHDKNEARIAISGVPDVPGAAARIFGALDTHGIVVDLIVQTSSRDGRTDVSFTVGRTDLARATEVVTGVGQEMGAASVQADGDVAKVSVVGVGMRNHSGVAARMFSVLSEEGINIHLISTSEIKVSCLIPSAHTERAVRALHTAFGLDSPQPVRMAG